MSHKYDPSSVHAGLLIYSVDGQTDFVLNDAMLRIKTGDILIHRTHHVLVGQGETYRELIRTLFGTHRINLIGLAFTFSGNGEISDCLRWNPTSSTHTSPAHPTEQKLLEIVLVSLYMNNAWLSMPMASRIDLENLSQSTKKQFLLKLASIEDLFNHVRQQKQSPSGLFFGNLLKFHPHHSSDSFRSFEWTPNRIETFDMTIRGLLDQFYNIIEQIFPEGEFDPDQYAYFDDNTRQLMSNFAAPFMPPLINPSVPNSLTYTTMPQQNYY